MRYSLIIISLFTLLSACSSDNDPPAPETGPCTASPPFSPGPGESFFFSGELLQSGANLSMTITDGCRPRFFSDRFSFPSDTTGFFSFGMLELDEDGDLARSLEIGTLVDNVNSPRSIHDRFSEGNSDITSMPGSPGIFFLHSLGDELRITSTEDNENPGFFRVLERSPIIQEQGLTWFNLKADFEMAVRLETTGETDRLRGSVSLRVFLP